MNTNTEKAQREMTRRRGKGNLLVLIGISERISGIDPFLAKSKGGCAAHFFFSRSALPTPTTGLR